MPTMSDVARRAKLALSTVSCAISGDRPVSEAPRQHPFAALDAPGEKPDALARGLASHSRIIALLFPLSERGLGFTELEFVTSAVHTAREHGYNLVLWSSALNDLADLRDFTQQGLADGVLVMEIRQDDERIQFLREVEYPFSMIGRVSDEDALGYVDIDFRQTMHEAIRCLTDLGHRNIAFLNQSQAAFDAGYGPVYRSQVAFEEEMRLAGLPCVTRFCPTTSQSGGAAFTAMLDEHPDLTALITLNERAVPGIMQGIADRGWCIPDDFSIIVVVSSSRIAEMIIPPLTTMEAMAAQMARRGVEQLISRLETAQENTEQVLLPCRLVVRGSTGPCRRQAACAE